MTVFLSGGAKNGKSTLAQTVTKTLAKGGAMYYVATMIPHDSEDDARIARHLQERDGWGFATLECGKQVKKVIADGNIQGAFLFDSVCHFPFSFNVVITIGSFIFSSCTSQGFFISCNDDN